MVVDDDEGSARVHLPESMQLHGCVCIGSVATLPLLHGLHRRGATVLNRMTAFVPLLHLVERALVRHSEAMTQSAPQVAASLRLRHRERLTMQQLTRTEREVLRAMVAGLTAAEIGRLRHVSLNTIRTHIKSIMAKLEVSTQLAAVAIARRTADPACGDQGTAAFISVGDEIRLSGRPG